MKISYVKEHIISKDSKDFYGIKLVLLDSNGVVVASSKILLWLSEKQYNDLKI